MSERISRSQSARWAEAVNKVMVKVKDDVEKIFTDAAARGFPALPGADMATLVQVGQDAKLKLVEENGKIYDIKRQVLFDWEVLAIKERVTLARLNMEIYRVEIFLALELETARLDQEIAEKNADVERWLQEIESRQVHIVRDRALAEQNLLALKRKLVQTQEKTLPLERILVQTQLQTALKKLEIINSIYQVIAAEQLVLVAERQRIAALQDLVTAKQALAQAKLALIPAHQAVANAQTQLAAATTEEVASLKGIAQLSVVRGAIALAQAHADATVMAAEAQVDVARGQVANAEKALELLRAQAREAVAVAGNAAKLEAIGIMEGVHEGAFDLSQYEHIQRIIMQTVGQEEVYANEITNINIELSNLLKNLEERASSDNLTTRAEAAKVILTAATTAMTKKQIVKD